jgi:hypothetical protein
MIDDNFFIQQLLDINVHKIINRAIAANVDIIIDQNLIQLDKGLDSLGSDLGIYARYAYKDRWKPIDLNLSGDFRRSIYPQFSDESFTLEASDPKTSKLQMRYGDEILGLSEEGKQMAGEFIQEDVQNLFKEEVLRWDGLKNFYVGFVREKK